MKIITTAKLLPTKEEAEILEKAITLLERTASNMISWSPLECKVNKAFEALYALDDEIDYSIVNGVNEELLDGEVEKLFDDLTFEDNEKDEEDGYNHFKSQYELNP